MTIEEFLLARIAQAELVATQRGDGYLAHAGWCDYPGDMPGICNCEAKTRALAECEAKRKLIEAYQDALQLADRLTGFDPRLDSAMTEKETYEQVLVTLAAVYRAHPDFDPSWGA